MWKFTASRADFYLWAVSELMSLLMVFLLLPRSMECLVTITENETDFYATLQDIHRNKCTHVHSGMMLVYCFFHTTRNQKGFCFSTFPFLEHFPVVITTVCLGSTNDLCLSYRLRHVNPLKTT